MVHLHNRKHEHHDHEHHNHVHAHHAHHGHSHSHAPQKFTTAFLIATSINLLFVIIEAVYAIAANSMSLLADAGHNLGDVLGLAMSGAAMWLLNKSATKKYSYGFKRTTILAALANAVILVVATIWIVIESIDKLFHPVSVGEVTIMVVAAIGILVNGGTALLFMRGQHDDLNVKGAFLHLAYDALISFGVVVVGALVLWTHWLWLDPLVGIIIAITILFGTWGLLRHSLDMILDAVPYNISENRVREYLQHFPKVQEVHHLHIWGLSTQEVALTAHLVVPDQTFGDADLRRIENELAAKFKINHATIQVERGAHDTEHC